MERIGVSIQYSTQDQEFILGCIGQALLITPHVTVGYMDRQFDGESEDLALIEAVKEFYPQIEFYMVKWAPVDPWLFHSKVRQEAFKRLRDKVEYILYLDSDEIVDGQMFKSWAAEMLPSRHESYKFLNYVYFASQRYRAKTWQDSPTMRRVDKTIENLFYSQPHLDRLQLATNCLTRIGYKGKPMFDHYSWAKGERQMERKLRTFAHRPKTEEEIQLFLKLLREFDGSGRDPVWGYEYDIINR